MKNFEFSYIRESGLIWCIVNGKEIAYCRELKFPNALDQSLWHGSFMDKEYKEVDKSIDEPIDLRRVSKLQLLSWVIVVALAWTIIGNIISVMVML